MIPYSDVESDVLDRFSSPNALRNRSQIARGPYGSYRSGELALNLLYAAGGIAGLKGEAYRIRHVRFGGGTYQYCVCWVVDGSRQPVPGSAICVCLVTVSVDTT